MTENPFKPHTPIEKTSPMANEKLVASLLGVKAAVEYEKLDEGSREGNAEEGADLTLTLEEKNTVAEARRDTPESIQALIKDLGSPAELDTSFMGGIVSIDVPPEVTDWDTAIASLTSADNGSPLYIWPEWQKGDCTPPETTHLDIIVLSYNSDPNIRESSDAIVADMDHLGFRPLILEEMFMAGIVEPRFTKTPGKYFVSLTKYERDGSSYAPRLWQDDRERRLGRSAWGGGWDGWDRFLCVRK